MLGPAVGGRVCKDAVPQISPYELLVDVVRGEPTAPADFTRWLLHHPQRLQVPPQVRQDVLHDVAAHFLDRAPEILRTLSAESPRSPDRRVHAYVARSIVNRYRTLLRRRQHETLLASPQQIDALEGELRPSRFERGLALLESVEREVVEAAARPDDARRTLCELQDLALGRRTMPAVVDEELTRDPGADPLRVRDRLYLRHRRMRRALLAAVAAMLASGRLDEDDATMLEALVEGLLKRRSTQRPA
ncbi:MAG: hypothetical protein R3F59_31290 [Myxococcota bacterium]